MKVVYAKEFFTGITDLMTVSGELGKTDKGDWVLINTPWGKDLGQVWATPREKRDKDSVIDGYKVLRKANENEVKKFKKNQSEAEEIFDDIKQLILEKNRNLKVVNIHHPLDKSKLVITYSAETKINTKNIARELAKKFKMRIEMKQIGIRDATKVIGGYGICGLPLCCTFSNLQRNPISLKMAKEQYLQVNASKLTGSCGRLMCCLAYEYETYKEEKKHLPKPKSKVIMNGIKGEIIIVNVISRKVWVEFKDEESDIRKVIQIPADALKEESGLLGKVYILEQGEDL